MIVLDFGQFLIYSIFSLSHKVTPNNDLRNLMHPVFFSSFASLSHNPWFTTKTLTSVWICNYVALVKYFLSFSQLIFIYPLNII